MLLATAAYNFSTSQLQKVLRDRQFFNILTWKCASRHSGVQFLISPLTTWLRTRRFNEPTFRLTRHTNHWKNTAFRDFSNIWRGCIFFLLTFALLHLLSSESTSSSDFTFFGLYFIYLLFICFSTLHIVGSLLFKLPSNISSSRESSGWTCSTNLNMKWHFIIVDKRPGTSPVVWTCFLVLRWMLTLVFVDLQHMLTLIIFATLERIFTHLHAFVFCKCLTTSYGWGKVCKESLKVLETTPLLGD